MNKEIFIVSKFVSVTETFACINDCEKLLELVVGFANTGTGKVVSIVICLSGEVILRFPALSIE